jgi:hypothetical protein
MGWIERGDQYKQLKRLGSKSTEDKVARRILRGLNLVESDLPHIEKELFGKYDDTNVLLDRVKAVLQVYIGRKKHLGFQLLESAKQIEVISGARTAKQIHDKVHMWLNNGLDTKLAGDASVRPFICTTVPNDDKIIGVSVPLSPVELGEYLNCGRLIPPFSVVELPDISPKQVILVLQELEYLVKGTCLTYVGEFKDNPVLHAGS